MMNRKGRRARTAVVHGDRPLGGAGRFRRQSSLAAVLALTVGLTVGQVHGQVACPDDNAGSIAGRVWDASQTLGLPGVEVTIRWAGGSVLIESDADGSYTACSLPVNEPMTAFASFGGLSSSAHQFSLAAGESHQHEFLIGMAARQQEQETGRVLGSVIDAVSGEPVEAAVIGVPGASIESLTSTSGTFTLDNVRAGELTIELRHLAYGTQSASVEVKAGASTSLLIRADPQPIELEPLDVTIEAVRDLGLEIRGFYERREWHEKTGLGHFITSEDIERRGPRLLSHMIAFLPSTRLDCSQSPLSQRCELSFVGVPRSGGCQRADVFVDGINVIKSDRLMVPHTLDELVRPSDIAAVEVYPSAASLPAEFSGASGMCGAIVIWTK